MSADFARLATFLGKEIVGETRPPHKFLLASCLPRPSLMCVVTVGLWRVCARMCVGGGVVRALRRDPFARRVP